MSIERLKKHVEKYGSEQVMEAAVDGGLSFDKLVELQKFVDDFHKREAARSRFAPYKRPRLSAETRVKRLLGIEEEEEADE